MRIIAWGRISLAFHSDPAPCEDRDDYLPLTFPVRRLGYRERRNQRCRGAKNEYRNPRPGPGGQISETEPGDRLRQYRGSPAPPARHAGGTGPLALGKPGGEQRKNPARDRATRPWRGHSRRPARRLSRGIEGQA